MQKWLGIFFTLLILTMEAKLPEIAPRDVTFKAKEFMKSHASHKKLTNELMQRILINYLEILDPNKTYFIKSDISLWQDSSSAQLDLIIQQYYKHDFSAFEKIHQIFLAAIERRRGINKQLEDLELPADVKSSEFKEMKWSENEADLKNKLLRIRSLQAQTTNKLSADIQEKALLRIQKVQHNFESEAMKTDPVEKERFILSNILKATASSLDSHSAYFTPGEAAQFMIDVQHRLFGIGAQLRDDLNGITVVKILEGGPAAVSKELHEKDRIVAVNNEPVVGMDMFNAVELIRGKENTPVKLTVIREETKENGEKEEKQLDVTLLRGEVVIKEMRFDSQYEPFGSGVIGYLKLFSFYEDRDSSSTEDLKREIQKLKNEHHLKGLILDLRYNAGGLLNQAVDVAGLFITTGIVVSIKDENGRIQHLRVIDDEVTWDGPLIILVSRASASASEIVAQTLQDYGRAIIVGDEHTFGKGSFQTFTLSTNEDYVNPEGEFKVTRGRYYTVSGKTPQLVGVASDICVPSVLCEREIGEKFSKYPLENDVIPPNFVDTLLDVPESKKEIIREKYGNNLQPKLDIYSHCLPDLKKNSQYRIDKGLNYQNFLKELKKKDESNSEDEEKFGVNDLQLDEAYNVMKDLILLLSTVTKEEKIAA